MSPPRDNRRHALLCLIITIAFSTVFTAYHSVTIGAGQSGLSVDLDLEYFRINDDEHITLKIEKQEDNEHADLAGIVVNLFLNEISDKGRLGSITTGARGTGRLKLDENFQSATDTLNEYIFVARLESDDRYEDTETELTIRKSGLQMEMFTEDEKNYIKAALVEMTDAGERNPAEGEELLFEVKRQLGFLPVAEFAFTDENGEVEIAFPDDLPGDEEGNLVIVVRLDEHPLFGNVEIHETAAWGIPLATTAGLDENRTWMGKDPPIFFAVIFWGGIIVIWGIIGYIIFNIYQIKQPKL